MAEPLPFQVWDCQGKWPSEPIVACWQGWLTLTESCFTREGLAFSEPPATHPKIHSSSLFYPCRIVLKTVKHREPQKNPAQLRAGNRGGWRIGRRHGVISG